MRRIPDWAKAGQSTWRYVGLKRPSFARAPRSGQQSVWDYPRPPRVEAESRPVLVRLGPTIIAQSSRAWRVLETASPPTCYLPPEDVQGALLSPSAGTSRCEWKGVAVYSDLILPGKRIERAAWHYPEPFPGFEEIQGYYGFYPALLECFLDGERVRPQPGRFYGGWVTSDLAGPFKGEPGSEGW